MEKQYIATQKYVQTTPRKLRLVADAAKKLTPLTAVEVLPYSNKRAANALLKVVKTAISNAKQAGVSDSDLLFSEVQITQGPVLKRFIPVSRGQAHSYKKRMSHIRVVLKEKVEAKNKKSEKNEQKQTGKEAKV